MEPLPGEGKDRSWLGEALQFVRMYGPWGLLPLFFAMAMVSRPPSQPAALSERQPPQFGLEAIRASVRAVSLSDDEQYVDVLQSDATWRRHDAHTGRELWRRSVTATSVSKLAIRSANLAAVGRTKSERLVLIENENPLWESSLPGQLPDEGIQSVSWCEARPIAAAVSDRGSLWLIDAADARVRSIRQHELGRPLDAVCWSPAGDRLAIVTSERGVLIWDAGRSQVAGQLSADVAKCQAVGWSRDGNRIITFGQEKLVQVWNSRSLELVKRLATHSQLVLAAGLSPDGSLAAVADSDTIALWELASETVVASLIGHEAEVTLLSFDHTGNTLISVDGQNHIIRWSVVDGRTIWQVPQ